MLDIRNTVERCLEYYTRHNVTWKISGWYKPGVKANDDDIREPIFHLTSVAPMKILTQAPIFQTTATANQQAPAEMAVTRPCQMRIGPTQQGNGAQAGTNEADLLPDIQRPSCSRRT